MMSSNSRSAVGLALSDCHYYRSFSYHRRQCFLLNISRNNTILYYENFAPVEMNTRSMISFDTLVSFVSYHVLDRKHDGSKQTFSLFGAFMEWTAKIFTEVHLPQGFCKQLSDSQSTSRQVHRATGKCYI